MTQIEDKLLVELRALGVNVNNYRVLSLLPLVFVAWADGKVQPAEREAILGIAKKQTTFFEFEQNEGLLLHWLDEEPTPEYYEKGFAALVELARRQRGVGASLDSNSLQELIELGLDVAKAAGGLLGQYWTVSPEEELAICAIAKALSIDDGAAWKEMLEDLK